MNMELDELGNFTDKLQKFFNLNDIPEKIEIGNFPVFEKVYKPAPAPPKEVDLFNSKICNIKVKFVLSALVGYKALNYFNKG